MEMVFKILTFKILSSL
uniref:Uncharacterized protein n=1 Tax=Anguilla anguilla TaxID=7936 RepID=A0A0E9UJN2_ANGAN